MASIGPEGISASCRGVRVRLRLSGAVAYTADQPIDADDKAEKCGAGRANSLMGCASVAEKGRGAGGVRGEEEEGEEEDTGASATVSSRMNCSSEVRGSCGECSCE